MENISLTIYANTTSIGSQTLTLSSGSSTIIVFNWKTTGFAMGNYTISAFATPVPNETNMADNTDYSTQEVATIPEFPSAIILLLPMIITMSAAIFAEKRFPRRRTRARFGPNASNSIPCI